MTHTNSFILKSCRFYLFFYLLYLFLFIYLIKRVLGTRRLRVIDGSVLQQRHTSINDVTLRMLGQFAADVIFDDWNALK